MSEPKRDEREHANPFDLGDESEVQDKDIRFKFEKTEVHAYDIFKLATRILIVCASVYLLIALVRVFYNDPNGYEKSGIREVWEYTKTFLNSIVSLVLGLYLVRSMNASTSNPT